MTDGLAMFPLKGTLDLLMAPGLPQQRLHLLPGCQGKARAPFGCQPGLCQAMGLVRPIAPAAPVLPEFPTDPGLRHSHYRGKFRLVLLSFQ